MSNDRQEVLYECKFILVEFVDDCQSDDQLLPIELVPKTWVNEVKGYYFCKYPLKRDFEYVERWTKEEKDPERSWRSYPVTLFHGADDFDQGKRRLERAYENRNCASTDGERQKSAVKHNVIPNSELNKMLRAKTSMNVRSDDGGAGSKTVSHSSRSQSDKPKQRASWKKKARNRHESSDNSSDSEASPDSLRSPIENPKKQSEDGTKNGESRSQTNLHSKVTDIDNNNKAVSSGRFDSTKIAQSASSTSFRNNSKFHLAGTATPQPLRKERNQRSEYDDNESECNEDLVSEQHTTSQAAKTSRTKERNGNNIKLNDALVEFIHEKFEVLECSVNQKLKSVKNSILYNIEHKMEELKLAIVATNIPRVLHETAETLVTAVKTPLPIATLDEFLEFDRAVNEDQEKKDALIALFNFLCFEHPTAQKCIDNVLPRIFKKEVQGKYSGQGKKAKGSAKLNFSATATFACFQQAIRAKFGESDESKGLKSKIGTWLSHFGDREGGRKERHVPDIAA